METYLVGGAVRDQVLKRPVTEQDWVVVGVTPEKLLAMGYRPVGKDFPVFLHPDTHEEYALARTERKTGPGYTGFQCYAAPDVTLEDDLKRRDFTMNAMAMTADDRIIDPFHGQRDCEAKVLRHVSEAFVEDPVRILRAARFCSQLPAFTIAPETLALMQQMVANGEADHLVKERLWQECEKAMEAVAPWRFFEVLDSVNLLSSLCRGVKPNGEHLRAATQSSQSGAIRWSSCWFGADGDRVKALCQNWRAPKAYAALSEMLARYGSVLQHHYDEPQLILDTLQYCDAFRRPQRFGELLTAVEAVAGDDTLKSFWEAALQALKSCIVDFSECEEGVDIKAKVEAIRLAQLEGFLSGRS